MKILMLGWELPPLHSGGLGIVCHQMCKEMCRQNLSVDFMLPYRSDEVFDDDINVISASDDPQSVYALAEFYGASRLDEFGVSLDELDISSIFDLQHQYSINAAKVAHGREFEIIHAHDWLTFGAAKRIKDQSGRPMVVHIHSTEHDRAAGGYGDPRIRHIEHQGLVDADSIIAISNHTKNIIVDEYGIDPGKITVVHNSTDVIKVDKHREHNVFKYLNQLKEHDFKVVVNVGRLTIQKGLPYLLSAMQKVVEQHPKTMLLIVGSGDMYHELIERSAELGIAKHVIFTGWINDVNDTLGDAFSIGDVFVMPSISEPFGVAALEAVAYGVPTVVSKQSGVSEVVANMLRSDYWDENRLADQILAIIKHDSLAQALSENSSHEFAGMSWTDSVSQLINHFENTLEAHAS